MKESVMTTSIEVENESVKQVVQNNIDSLRQTLQQNGIQLSSFSVSLSQQHEQKTPGKSGGKKEKYQENDEVKSAAGEKKTKSKKMGYNTYEYLA
jgi:flagellar hook-length control protein FliK